MGSASSWTGSGRAGYAGARPTWRSGSRRSRPSDDLRRWFSHDPAKWEGFRKRYVRELEGNEKGVEKLLEVLASTDMVTFVYSAEDEKRNSAVVLQEFLKSKFGLR